MATSDPATVTVLATGETQYSFPITNTPNNAVDAGALSAEIKAAGIASAVLDAVSTTAKTTIHCIFSADLSQADQNTLANVIANTPGTPLMSAGVFHGSGDPNGNITADPGSIYQNTAGSPALWVKESGRDAFGWTAK